jgi:hypothetical protein
MDAKKFISGSLIISLTMIFLFGLVNYYIDPYGLFGNRNPADVKVYGNDRTSKHLMSYKYIPENFDALWLGPSLSANINTKEAEEMKIYNASIMAANITELSAISKKAVTSGGIEYLILCLDPYITKDSGFKTNMINEKEYMGAFGSTVVIHSYVMKILRELEIFPNKYAKGVHNNFGYNNYNIEMQKAHASDTISAKVKSGNFEPITFDKTALKELDDFLNFLRENKVKIYAYHTPIPKEVYEFQRGKYLEFRALVNPMFENGDVLVDMNAPQFDTFVSNYDNYIDHGHLSVKGQRTVLNTILNEVHNN